MKRTLLALVILAFGFASCNKEPQLPTKAQINQKIDSLTTVRIKESDEQAQRDLQHRIEIEVKVKADSIVSANAKRATDSLNKPKVNAAAPRPRILGNVK